MMCVGGSAVRMLLREADGQAFAALNDADNTQ
jgi:hypothetical protein